MKKQTQSQILKPKFEHIDSYNKDKSIIKAKLVQSELNQGDFFAIEMQKSLDGMNLFLSSPITLQAETYQQIQSNIEPFADLYGLCEKITDRSFRHSCPICKSADNVVLNGHIQRICRNSHDENNKTNYFSGPTSYEANQSVVILASLVAQQLYGNSTHDFINQFLGVSRYFVEFVSSFLAENLPMKTVSDLEFSNNSKENNDLLVIFSDFSGSRLAKRISLLVAEINGELIWYIYQSPNNIVAQVLVDDIATEIDKQGFKGQVVMITDGEFGWVDPIRNSFKDAIHIRQFHKKELLGIVFVHFIHDKKEHTLKCRWDLVKEKLNDENMSENVSSRSEVINEKLPLDIWDQEVSTSTKTKRRWRKNQVSKNDENMIDPIDQSSEIDTICKQDINPYHVTLYEARIWTSRGKRTATKSVADKGTVKTTTDVNKEIIKPNIAIKNHSGEYVTKSRNTATTAIREGIDSMSELKKRGRKSYSSSILFQGDIRDAITQFPWLLKIYQVLIVIFGGIHITSNRAENPFKIKHKFQHHGPMKAGYRHLKMQLAMTRFPNLDLFRGWLKQKLDENAFLLHEIQRDKSMITKKKNKKELLEHLVFDQIIVIDYENNTGKRSIRVIEILEQIKSNGVFNSYCYLRNEERNFQIDRIINFCQLDEYYALLSWF